MTDPQPPEADTTPPAPDDSVTGTGKRRRARKTNGAVVKVHPSDHKRAAPKKNAKKKGAKKRAKKKVATTAPTKTIKQLSKRPRGGRPAFRPSEQQLRQLEVVASLAPFGRREFSLLLEIDAKTFDKYYDEYFQPAIEKGQAKGRLLSGAVLAKKMRGGDMTALIWYEKTRLGMTEKVHTVVSSPSGGPIESNVNHSGTVAVGLYLPPNGRDVMAEGQKLPASMEIPANAREVPTEQPTAQPTKE